MTAVPHCVYNIPVRAYIVDNASVRAYVVICIMRSRRYCADRTKAAISRLDCYGDCERRHTLIPIARLFLAELEVNLPILFLSLA